MEWIGIPSRHGSTELVKWSEEAHDQLRLLASLLAFKWTHAWKHSACRPLACTNLLSFARSLSRGCRSMAGTEHKMRMVGLTPELPYKQILGPHSPEVQRS